MKKILLILLLTSGLFANDSQYNDADKPFFKQRDNLAHITLNAGLCWWVTTTARNYGLSKTQAFLLGTGTGIAFGFFKESVVDKNFDRTDMQSWAIGAATGAAGGVIWRF